MYFTSHPCIYQIIVNMDLKQGPRSWQKVNTDTIPACKRRPYHVQLVMISLYILALEYALISSKAQYEESKHPLL